MNQITKEIFGREMKLWRSFLLLSVIVAIKLFFLAQMAFTTRDLIDSIGSPAVYSFGAKLLLVMIVWIVTAFCEQYFMYSLSYSIEKDLSYEVYNHIQSLPLSYLSKTKSGDLVSRIISDVPLVASWLGMNFPTIFFSIAHLAVSAYVVLSLSPLLGGILVITLPVFYWMITFCNKRMSKYTGEARKAQGDVTESLREKIEGVKTIRTLNRASYFASLFLSEQKRRIEAFKKYAYWALWTSSIMTYGIYALPVVMVVIGTIMVSRGFTTVGVLVALWSCMGALIEPVTRLTNANNSIQAAIPAAVRVFSILKVENETNGGDRAPPEKAPSINVEDLWFKYDESWILKGLNIRIERGEKIALVGSSGSGKSTLIDILLGFNQPVRGRVLIDNEDLRNYNLNKLRDRTGVARQSDFLFNLSVKDNVTLGDYSQERFEKALEISQASEFVYDLPQGVDTIIGERGASLSDGQKQRIAIARALYREPKLLILDEATSTIDSSIENKILSNIKALDATVIVVAHRLSTVKNMDSIIFLRNGKIMYKGSHQELLKYPEYMELFERQV